MLSRNILSINANMKNRPANRVKVLKNRFTISANNNLKCKFFNLVKKKVLFFIAYKIRYEIEMSRNKGSGVDS